MVATCAMLAIRFTSESSASKENPLKLPKLYWCFALTPRALTALIIGARRLPSSIRAIHEPGTVSAVWRLSTVAAASTAGTARSRLRKDLIVFRIENGIGLRHQAVALITYISMSTSHPLGMHMDIQEDRSWCDRNVHGQGLLQLQSSYPAPV